MSEFAATASSFLVDWRMKRLDANTDRMRNVPSARSDLRIVLCNLCCRPLTTRGQGRSVADPYEIRRRVSGLSPAPPPRGPVASLPLTPQVHRPERTGQRWLEFVPFPLEEYDILHRH